MKKFLVVLMLAVFTSVVFAADAIYLKSGKILKGKITEESGDSISIETADEWKEINRKDIKKIERDKEKKEEKTETKEEESKGISTLKFGLDISGNHESTVSSVISGDATADVDVNTGVTFTWEDVWSVGKNVGLGWGSSLELPRATSVSGAEDAWFMFWPLYGIFQVSDYETKGISPYGTLQLGFNYFMGSDEYIGPGGQLYMGFYLGIGGGITSKKNGFQAELLYASHGGGVYYDEIDIGATGNYTTLRLSVGYNF